MTDAIADFVADVVPALLFSALFVGLLITLPLWIAPYIFIRLRRGRNKD